MMKTLANCSAVEFLRQTNKIIKNVKSWLNVTEVVEIFKSDKPTKEKIEEMLDKMLDEYPSATAEVFGLVCFIDPKDLDKYKGIEIMTAAMETLTSEEVIGFFTSFLKLGNLSISDIAKA